MAKPRHNPQPTETSPRGMLAILTIGALLVAGLVVWALTRTVEPTETPAPSVAETATPATALDTVSTAAPTVSPIASTTAGITTSSQAPVASGDNDEVPRISAEDLREKVKA